MKNFKHERNTKRTRKRNCKLTRVLHVSLPTAPHIPALYFYYNLIPSTFPPSNLPAAYVLINYFVAQNILPCCGLHILPTAKLEYQFLVAVRNFLLNVSFNYLPNLETVFFICTSRACDGKGKGKVHPRTGHEGPEGEVIFP
jgi:hypothetical protein